MSKPNHTDTLTKSLVTSAKPVEPKKPVEPAKPLDEQLSGLVAKPKKAKKANDDK